MGVFYACLDMFIHAAMCLHNRLFAHAYISVDFMLHEMNFFGQNGLLCVG